MTTTTIISNIFSHSFQPFWQKKCHALPEKVVNDLMKCFTVVVI
jgi:hypothetical protein